MLGLLQEEALCEALALATTKMLQRKESCLQVRMCLNWTKPASQLEDLWGR
jgi:hypothetical protein